MQRRMLLSTIPLFSDIRPQDLDGLLTELGTQTRRYTAGETLLPMGERTERFGIVLAGRIGIIKEDFEGNATLLAQLKQGDLFAEAFACTKKPLTVAVRAETPAEILWIPYAGLRAPHSAYDAACRQIGDRLTESFAAKNLFLTGRIEHLAKRTLREKVLSYLSEASIQAGSRSFSIPLDRQQMADYLAADRSALSAVLGRLRDEEILLFCKNQFTLL